ncbi:MAG: hypothetical protein AAF623_11250 [Planctomycetota bacterium]
MTTRLENQRNSLNIVFWLALVTSALFVPPRVAAQQAPPPTNVTLQLPVLRFFNIRTTVMVPDGGIMSLGGIGRSRSTSSSRGIPGTLGRPFANRSSGFQTSGSHLSVKPRIIISSELEADVLAEAERRHAITELSDPNGPAAVRQKADFISRNIGRKRKR